MTNRCIMCGAEIPEGELVCKKCFGATVPKLKITEPPEPNVGLSFGAGDGRLDFIITYRREKPLNWFQILMFKVCFGIRAINL